MPKACSPEVRWIFVNWLSRHEPMPKCFDAKFYNGMMARRLMKDRFILYMAHIIRLLMAAFLMLAITSETVYADAGETLTQIKKRGELRCGVSDGIPGFSSRDAKGIMTGLDVDFCRAVAAVVLGDATKVTFVQLRASERFPALKGGTVDLLARNTTWTLSREISLKVLFAGILFYDGQGFMVPKKFDQQKVVEAKKTVATKSKTPVKKAGEVTIASLDKAKICVEKSTTHLQNLANTFAARGMSFEPVIIDSASGVADAFFAGRCVAYTGDAGQLAAARMRAPGGASAYLILPERISKEPLGPVVRAGDDDWLMLVRWVLFTLVDAEEMGLTRNNVLKRLREPEIQQLISAGNDASKSLDIPAGAGVRAIQSVGNYGEMFERNVGRDSPLKIERGLNKLWTQGGLMYAPPLL
jgi:general L-amino acid transport system substrate-binding protein